MRRPWCTVRRETVELPDERCIPEYYVFEYPAWVNVIATTRDGRFVMIDQYRHGLGETSYEIPAGCVESDDASTLAAAQRELAEETGYGVGDFPGGARRREAEDAARGGCHGRCGSGWMFGIAGPCAGRGFRSPAGRDHCPCSWK